MRLMVLDSGIANVASVTSAFRALGCEPAITRDAVVAREATHLVLPGVGSFGAGMAALRSTGLDRVVLEAVEKNTPLLAICLGLQLLTEGSDESPGVMGLGVIPARCVRLPDSVRVPQLGWNAVNTGVRGSVEPGFAAYANSYAITGAPIDWAATWTEHGVRLVASLERGGVLGVQFHPELSGKWGLELLRRWVEGKTGSRLTSYGSRLTHRIIPCLDVANGRIVKGVKFQNLRDAGDPAERAALYEAQGADEIVLLDITASPQGRDNQVETVRRVRDALHIPLTVGGGVRGAADAARLLGAGADKVSLNTAAVQHPELLSELAGAFGCQCVVLAVDARSMIPSRREAEAKDPAWGVLTNGGRADSGRDAIEWIRQGTRLGAGEILLTSWDRDGTRSGADLELLNTANTAVTVPVIASGGIGTRQDIADALDSGADAVLAASIFHDGDETVAGVKQWLASRGYEVRP
jgi:imidazole glycerol phosphate synthase glutamine amidotransferase subunit